MHYKSQRDKDGKAEKGTPRKYNPCKLRKNIEPGSILILLAGRFRGRRVVFLKMLESGALLLTGPYGVNGVPLRRAHQRYCIGTSTKVDIGKVDVSKINDDFFKRKRVDYRTKARKMKSEAGMFATEPEKNVIDPERKAMQKTVDQHIEKGLSTEMKGYLMTRFTLHGRMFPHELKF